MNQEILDHVHSVKRVVVIVEDEHGCSNSLRLTDITGADDPFMKIKHEWKNGIVTIIVGKAPASSNPEQCFRIRHDVKKDKGREGRDVR